MKDEYKAGEELGWGSVAILLICIVVAVVNVFNILGVMV